MSKTAPLWSLCSLNDHVLPESTPPDYEFEYVDISNVEQNYIANDLEIYSFKAAPSRARRLAEPGDLIVSTVRTYLRAIAQVQPAERSRVYSTGFAVLHPIQNRADSRYLSYVLTSDVVVDEIVAASTGVSYPAIQGSELHRLRIPFHNLETQRRIADYLDRETGQIDAMIDKLGELESDLALRKDSVVKTELIDEEHKYPRVPLQAIASIHSGDTISASKIEKTGEYPVYGGNGVRGFTKNYNESQNRVLIGRQGALCGNVHQAVAPFWASEHALVLSPYDDVDLRWLEYATRNLDLGRLSTSAAQPGITASGVGRERLPLPPREEQRRIADHLDDVTSKIDTMLAKVAELKDLLTERRAALITDVVTGRKDVA
jgi:type I restriction enzyme S subunit